MFAVDRLWVEADVADLCPPRPARIKDYNERSRRAGYRRDAHRTRTGESLHRCAVSTAILVSWLLSPTRCRASGAERADRIRSRDSSTQPRQYRRTRYFGRNELSRLCLAVLRTAAGTLLSADDIAWQVIAGKSFDDADRILRGAIRDQAGRSSHDSIERVLPNGSGQVAAHGGS